MAHSKLLVDFPEFAGTTRRRVRKCMRELGIRGKCPNASKKTAVADGDVRVRPSLVTIGFIESYYNRYRPHEAIGDCVPAEVMDEFFGRFEALS